MPAPKKMIHMGAGYDPFFVDDTHRASFESALDVIVGFKGTSQWNVHKYWDVASHDYHNTFWETNSEFAVYQDDLDGAPLYIPFAQNPDGSFARRSMDLKSEDYRAAFADACRDVLDDIAQAANSEGREPKGGMFIDDTNLEPDRMFNRAFGVDPLMSFGSSYYEPAPADTYRRKVMELTNVAGYWPLDAGWGLGAQVGSQDAVPQGGVTVGQGGYGPTWFDNEGSTQFDGTNDFFSVDVDPFAPGAGRTFFGWAWRDSDTTLDMLIAGNAAANVPQLSVEVGGAVKWRPAGGAGSGIGWPAAWPGTGQWVFWVLVVSGGGSTATLYINGALVSQQVTADVYQATPGNLNIGASGSGGGSSHWQGRMAHVGWTSGNLSATEISDLHTKALDSTPDHVGWSALLADFLTDIVERVKETHPWAKFIFNPVWNDLTPRWPDGGPYWPGINRWNDLRFEKVIQAADYVIIEHGHADPGLGDDPGTDGGPGFSLRSQFYYVDHVHELGTNVIMYVRDADAAGRKYEMAAWLSHRDSGDMLGLWHEHVRWPDYDPVFDTDLGPKVEFIDTNVKGSPIVAGFGDGYLDFTPGHLELPVTITTETLPTPTPGAIGFSGSNASYAIYSRGEADATSELTFAAVVRKRGFPAGTPKIFSLSSTGVFSVAGGKGGLALVNDDNDSVRLDAGGGGTWPAAMTVPFDEWCIVVATKEAGSDQGTMHCYPLTQVAQRQNLATNPKAGGVQTNGWVPAGFTTFEAVTLDGITHPAPTGLPAGVTTAFHAVGDGDNDRAALNFDAVLGQRVRLSVYVHIKTLTATGSRLVVHDAAGVNKGAAGTGPFATVGEWARRDIDLTPDSTGVWTVRMRQSGAGAIDFYWTATLIENGAELGEYYDGDTSGFEWSGTAQQSMSRSILVPALQWQHGVGWASRGDIEAWDRLVVGGWHGASDWLKGDVALLGIWNEKLNQVTVESLADGLSTQAWHDAGENPPAVLLEGRHPGQEGLATPPLVDLEGSSVQTFGQGITSVTDGPPGWTYGAVERPPAETLVGTLADDFVRGEFAIEEKISLQLATARRSNPDFQPGLANDKDQSNFWESDVSSIYNRAKNPKFATGSAHWQATSSSGFAALTNERAALPVGSDETGFGWHVAATQPNDSADRTAGLRTPQNADSLIEIEPGEKYTLIAEAYVESVDLGWTARIDAAFYDDAIASAGSSAGTALGIATGWNRFSRVHTMPEGTKWLRVNPDFRTATPNSSIDGYWTRFMVLKGDWTGAIPPYRDGDSLDGFWLGTPNESQSVRPEWWQVEMEGYEEIQYIDVHWSDRRADTFEIWTSVDGASWDTQFKGASEIGKQRIEVGVERARFLRVVPYDSITSPDPVRIYEIRAFGSKGSPPKYINFGPDDVVIKQNRLQISNPGAGTNATVTVFDKTMRDLEITGRFSFGPTGSRRQLVWKRRSIDSPVALTLRLLSDGEFRLMKVDAAGIESSLQLYAGNTILPEEGDHVWLRARQEGNTVWSQLFIDDPFLGAQPVNEFMHALVGSDRDDYGAFREGLFGARLYDGDTTDTGLEALVVSSFIPEQPTGVTFTPIFIPPVLWKFILAESETMKHLADVSYGRNKHLDVINNKAGACNFVVPVDSEDWEEIEEGKHCIIAYRKNDPKWSGPIWNLKEDLPENQLAVSAVGWFETLVGRKLRRDLTIGTPAVPVIPGEMGLRLLDEINTKQYEHYAFLDNDFIDQFNAPLEAASWDTSGSVPTVANGVLEMDMLTQSVASTDSSYDVRGQTIETRVLGATAETGWLDIDMYRPGVSTFFYRFRIIYLAGGGWEMGAYKVDVDSGGFEALTLLGAPVESTLRQPVTARLRANEDGSQITFEYSFDGVDWMVINTAASTWNMSDARIRFVGRNASVASKARIDYTRVGPLPSLQPSYIGRGTQGDTAAGRWRSFKRGDFIQPLMNQMVDIENGWDFKIDPLTRLMSTLPGSLLVGDSRIKDDVIFAYNWGPSNILKFGREGDFSVMRNRFEAHGKYTFALHEDLESQEEFSILMEEEAQLSEVVDPNVLITFAAGEVLLRSHPRKIVSFIPFPWNEENSVPEPFEDYEPGDRVRVSAKFGKRIAIDRLAVRIFGIGVDIDDNGNERISSLQVSP